jgi:hypothetical protein
MIDITGGEVAINAGEFSGSADAWVATKDTDALGEGSSNLYFTDARARGAVSVTDAGGDGSMAYNSSTGVFTYTGPSAAEVRAHFSGGEMIDIVNGEVAIAPGDFSGSVRDAVGSTDAEAVVRSHFSGGEMIDFSSGEFSINAGEFSGSADAWVATKDTDALSEGASNLYWTVARGESMFDSKLAAADTGDLSEGSNLYFTDARARAAVSVTDAGGDGSMAYDNSTGVLTYTGPSASEVRAHFSAGDAIDISSGVVAVSSSIAGDGLRFDADNGALVAQHSVKSIGITNADAEYGLNFQSGGAISTTVTVTLPKISTVDAGRVVMVKVAPLSGDGKVTVACATADGVTDTIDGPTDTSLDIESSGGAVTLIVADASNNIWAII